MHNSSRLVRQLITLVRNSGYLRPDHAMAVAGNILDARPLPDAFAILSPALIRHAALFDPFDREKLRLAEDVNSRVPHEPFTQWVDSARRLTDMDPVPEYITAPDPSTASPEAFVQYIREQPSNDNRFSAILHLWQTGAEKAFLEAVQIITASPSGLLAAPVMAWGAYAANQADLAGMLLDEGARTFQSINLRARMALDNGDTKQSIDLLRESLDMEPFQPAIIEQLASLEHSSSPAPTADTHICLYTWNKPDTLIQTITSLAQTDIGDAQITILNNGTTTCSPDALEQRVREAAPQLSIRWLHLPVNVGAPAARNWLLADEQVRQSDYVAFLDDDVLLPPDWLTRFHSTLARFPKAAAVGAKCLNAPMRTLQYAFRNFEDIGELTIRLTANAPTLMDMGQFDAPRPCLTVMGCCHLLDRKKLESHNVPDFDIRFSPSQVDDIEHDLQIWKAGAQVIYDGGVQVVHLQDTGKAPSQAAIGQAYANHYKMERKFSLTDLKQMDEAVKAADEKAFRQALHAVLPTITGSARVFWQTLAPLLRTIKKANR
ncbi:Glycosyl transferase family 2 [Pseudodesulfovibrio profundus]|uniref:Glycosyl transferase family 2 n=1 Tax=Pseudodesulfovibrio profundus TaxID=57320 RepID=A0A2C8FBJ5_9BACT|nr:glycosyltransferase [Pseudodesulfovibrio profundus]SOB59914.1 Glycosyl transferase family 2 [Pseudodesulfovibrio profundus]